MVPNLHMIQAAHMFAVEIANQKSWQVNHLGPLNVSAFPQVSSSLLRWCCKLVRDSDILLPFKKPRALN